MVKRTINLSSKISNAVLFAGFIGQDGLYLSFSEITGFERLEVQNVNIVKIIPAKHQLIHYIEVISQEQNTSGGFDGEDFLLARLRTPLRYPQ